LLCRFLETIPRQKKSSLKSLIESDSILLTPGQSLTRGGNNLDQLFTAPIRRRKNFSCVIDAREAALPDVPQGVLRQLQGCMFWWRAGGERKAAETFGENVVATKTRV
jgi:hypothetical protein